MILKAFFFNQWVNSVFNNWSFYLTTIGYSISNSPVETLIILLKDFLLKDLNFNMLKFEKDTYDHKQFLVYKKIVYSVKTKAKELLKNESKHLKDLGNNK